MKRKQPTKRKTSIFYLIFLLSIAVSIYFYLIKYQAKQRHLLPFHDTKLLQYKLKMSNKVKDIDIKNVHTDFSMILSI